MTRNPQNKRKSGSEDADRDKMESLDAEEENIRKFMETWSQIKFDSNKNSFTGKNEKGYTVDIDIDAVQNFDEGGMIKIAYLESLKTKKKDQWVKLPSEYKSYINEFAKDVLTYEDQIKKQKNIISDGMIPKLENCFHALKNGVDKVFVGSIGILNSEEKSTQLKI